MPKEFKFDYTVEMVGRLADKNHWHYEVWKHFLKKKNIEALPKDITLLPLDISESLHNCERCRALSKLDWNKQLRGTFLPLIDRDGRVWQPTSLVVDCLNCGGPIEVESPMMKWEGDKSNSQIYVDEAAREEKGAFLHVYSAICRPPMIADRQPFIDRFNNLKSELVPNLLPSEWRVHLKTLCDARARQRNQDFKHVTKTLLGTFINDVGQLVSEYSAKNLCVWNTAVLIRNPTQESRQWAKEATFYLVVVQPLSQSCKNGFTSFFNFEKTKKDGWAKNLFLKAMGTGAWAHISKGIPVGLPRFIPAQPNPYLEIVDMISFVTARYLMREYRSRMGDDVSSDYDPRCFGPVRYSGINADGIFDYMESEGYPEEFKYSI